MIFEIVNHGLTIPGSRASFNFCIEIVFPWCGLDRPASKDIHVEAMAADYLKCLRKRPGDIVDTEQKDK